MSARPSEASAKQGIISVPPDGRFRVLQLTDFHHDCADAEVERTWHDIESLVRQSDPHFLAITGDIWCSDGEPEQGRARMERDLHRIAALNQPWAFSWGNHDWGLDAIEQWQPVIDAAPNLCKAAADGMGCSRVEVHDRDRPAWDLFFLHSGAQWRPEQHLDWFERECARLVAARGMAVPAVVYFHIPLKQYEDARLRGSFTGVAQEEVLCWGDDGAILERLAAAGNVRACFCGHSHVNDFHTVSDGIVLAYGRATGHGGYGGDRLEKGATLLELDVRRRRLSFGTIFPDGRRGECFTFACERGYSMPVTTG